MNTPMNTPKQHLNEINLIRAIACIFVVATHAISNYLKNVDVDLTSDRYIVLIRYALLCSTPIFILISETLISKNYPEKLPKGFFLKRLRYIFIPYVLIGAIVSYRASARDWNSFLEVFTHKVIFGHWYGFFVLVIFQFYIIHWLVGKYLSKINPIGPLLLSFIISFIHIYSYVHIPEYGEFIEAKFPFWYRVHIFSWLFYFIAAFYIGQYYDRIFNFLNNKIWIPIVATLFSYSIILYDIKVRDYTRISSDRYDMMLFAVCVFFLLVVLIRKFNFNNKVLGMISHFSFFIYLTHMITISYFVKLSLTFGENFFSYVIIMVFLTISTSIGWAFLFYQTKPTQFFTGRIKYLDNK
ncbi:acyltransferase family protein [Sporosarcina jiandibaonis]|uniref:acyltransferase family protein n=1 Tax=Sporosarcina jiandibaonis TaxID=2715535 RepID=UPI001FE93BD9|nr:acyltransferase family protein [Sporosarcina jiandibaonis]